MTCDVIGETPPPREQALCELLFAHERDAALTALMAQYAPDAVLSHAFTRAFVAAWRQEAADVEGDAFAQLRGTLDVAACAWLDGILLGDGRTELSELPAARILQDLLRQLWVAAIRRRQGQLPAASSPENDRLRLELSARARLLQRAPWPRAAALMTPATLA